MKLLHNPIMGWCVQAGDGVIELAEFCRQARVRRGLTQYQITVMTGLSHPLYVNFETGKSKSLNTGLLALKVLDYDLSISGDPAPNSKKAAAQSQVAQALAQKRNLQTCVNGHPVDEWGKCLQLNCEGSRYSYSKQGGKKHVI
jgi:transcriptional regulator with XRE-family HTH domain